MPVERGRGSGSTIVRAARVLGVEPREPAARQRGARLVDPVVEAEVDDVVAGGVSAVAVPGQRRHAVRAQQPYSVRERVVVGDDHPALADREVLVREEAERAGERRRCRAGGRRGASRRRARRPRAARGRGRASDRGELAQPRPDGRRRSIVMIALRARRDRGLDGARRTATAPSMPAIVGEDRRGAACSGSALTVATKVSDGTIDLVARPEARGEAREVQRGGAVGDRERVAGAACMRRTPPRTPRCAGPC